MSLSSLLAEAEADIAKANPLAIMKAVLADIKELKADSAALAAELHDFRAALVAAQPALTAVLSILFPNGAAIPSELLALLDALPKASTAAANGEQSRETVK